jgi:hypothetical protein
MNQHDLFQCDRMAEECFSLADAILPDFVPSKNGPRREIFDTVFASGLALVV